MKWILRYLKGTYKTCLYFGTDIPVLVGCIDAYMVGDVDSRKSTSAYLITFLGGSSVMEIKFTKMCCFVDHRG